MLTFRIILKPRIFLLIVLGLLALPSAAAANQAGGPSFNCAHVTSYVNRTICATPDLAALDRKLATDYHATLDQAGIDAKALQADELHWLQTARNPCTSPACIEAAYRTRDAAILDLSLRAAGPAAYDDTRPYPAPDAALSAAQALVGGSCHGAPASPLPGTSKIPGFSPIVARNAFIAPLAIRGTQFAFLLTYPEDQPQLCSVRAFVVLPHRSAGESFDQCTLADDSFGFGIRQGNGATTAYWSLGAGSLTRVPIHVIGAQSLTCRQPETGE